MEYKRSHYLAKVGTPFLKHLPDICQSLPAIELKGIFAAIAELVGVDQATITRVVDNMQKGHLSELNKTFTPQFSKY